MQDKTTHKKELISVIVPIYNAASWLEACIDSILAQTYTDLEIILVNDGSTDGSGKICDLYAKKDHRIRVVHHQENMGVGQARNTGLDTATGDYIGWVDADDIVEPMMYERLVSAQADISVCAHRQFGKGREVTRGFGKRARYTQRHEIMQLMSTGPLLWDKLYRRKLWEGLRFPPCRVLEDLTVTCCLLSRTKSLEVFDEALYQHRIQSNGISQHMNPEECLAALKVACDSYHKMQIQQPQVSIFFLAVVFAILRDCTRSIPDRKTYIKLKHQLHPVHVLINQRKNQMIKCLKYGCLGRLEIFVQLYGGYSACLFSRLCWHIYDFNSVLRLNIKKGAGHG